MTNPTRRETISLPVGGRRVDVIEFGDPDGAPAMYLHGTPSSAREARWLHEPATTAHVRIISMDRPGYQASDPIASPSFEATAKVVVDVATHLGLGRFSVVGFSGGAGSALATAAVAPNRVNSVHLGGGMGSPVPGARKALPASRRIFFKAAASAPPVAKFLLGRMSKRMNKLLGPKLQMPTLAVLELLEGSAKGSQVSAAESFARTTAQADLHAWVSEYLGGQVRSAQSGVTWRPLRARGRSSPACSRRRWSSGTEQTTEPFPSVMQRLYRSCSPTRRCTSLKVRDTSSFSRTVMRSANRSTGRPF